MGFLAERDAQELPADTIDISHTCVQVHCQQRGHQRVYASVLRRLQVVEVLDEDRRDVVDVRDGDRDVCDVVVIDGASQVTGHDLEPHHPVLFEVSVVSHGHQTRVPVNLQSPFAA